MKLKTIKSPDDILKIISETGFLPFFANDISGFGSGRDSSLKAANACTASCFAAKRDL